MSNMKKKTKAFTLAEALILLLIAALIAAALVPVITRKHRDVAEHGKWICTLNSQGQHVIKTIYRGKTSDFKVAADDECIFTPPANAKNFTLKAVGGGGGGGGGTAGGLEAIYDSRTQGDSGTFATTVENDGMYSILAVGGGGGGGGMGCGEAKDQITAEAGFDLNKARYFITESEDHHGPAVGGVSESNQTGRWHDDWSWDEPNMVYEAETQNPNKTDCDISGNYTLDCQKGKDSGRFTSEDPYHETVYDYGYYDLPRPKSFFDYNLLVLNDKAFAEDCKGYGDCNDFRNGTTPPKAELTDEKGEKNGQEVSIFDYKYHYIEAANGDPEIMQQRAFCYAEPDWPLSKEIPEQNYKGLFLGDMDESKNTNPKCWNLPGEGGKKGITASDRVFIKGGSSVYATVGMQGKGRNLVATGLNPGKHSSTVGLYVPDSSFSNLYLKTASVEFGTDGYEGGQTSINYSGMDYLDADGGRGGYGRQLNALSFINIPVRECSVEQHTDEYADDYDCCGKNSWSCEFLQAGVCSSRGDGCTEHGPYTRCIKDHDEKYPCPTEEDPNKECTTTVCDEYQDYWTCSTTHHTGGYFKQGSCVDRVRPKYFESLGLNYCAYTAAIPENHPARSAGSAYILNFSVKDNFWTGLDFPELAGDVIPYQSGTDDEGADYDIAELFDRQRYQGTEDGSGGYGAGEQVKSYVMVDDNNNAYGKFYGEDGDEGYVRIVKSSAYGGSGGEAGQYVSTMMKKIGRLKIKVGEPGAPGAGGNNGQNGMSTTITQMADDTLLFELQGGKGGQANKMYTMAAGDVVPGGNGDPSPVENESNRAKIIAYGGKTDSNPNWEGQSATIFNTWDPSKAPYDVLPISATYILTGGHPLDLTYGAGGGGGAGEASNQSSDTATGNSGGNSGMAQSQKSGGGGAGTPGVVIIEW